MSCVHSGVRRAQAGYEHYEVSNYAAPGHRCRHNEVYWRNEPYYAFGLGSASYLHHRRFSRPRQMVAYRCSQPAELRTTPVPKMQPTVIGLTGMRATQLLMAHVFWAGHCG